MSAPLRPGAGLAALLSLLAVTATPSLAEAQAASRVWSTYLGGSGNEAITGLVQVPSSGDIVAVGYTNSLDFPPRTGTGNSPGRDAFMSVFTSGGFVRGSPVLFGGAGDDAIFAVALGAQGQLYVVGLTSTDDLTASFPFVYGSYGGAGDAFLARLAADGSPEWLMYLGSPGADLASGVTVSGSDIYVTGNTNACAFLGNSGTCLGGREAFVVKVSNNMPTPGIQWSKLLTGNGDDYLNHALVEGSSVVVVGSTSSSTFGSTAVQGSLNGSSDALVARLDVSSGNLLWMEYLGNSLTDAAATVLPGANGTSVVIGSTELQLKGKDVFATWLDSSGTVLQTRTFGGSDDEVVSSATIDSTGTLYIGGKTLSTDFPLAREFDSNSELSIPPQEGFVLTVPPAGGPGWASFVGGNSVDEVLSVSILDNRLMMAGQTSSSADLVINGTYDPTLNTPPDGFLVAVDTDITPPLVGMVYDRPQDDNTFTDIGTQTSRDSLSANWSDFMDPESGIERYEWALGTSPGAQDVSPFTPISVSLQRSFTKTGLSLTVGTTYYATVRAINGAGNTAMASSNGVRVVAPGTDGGTGNTDGGTGNTDGGTDGGMEQPGQGDVPLMGWSCSAGAGLPVFLGLLAVVFLARRRGPPVQSPRE